MEVDYHMNKRNMIWLNINVQGFRKILCLESDKDLGLYQLIYLYFLVYSHNFQELLYNKELF